MKTTSSGTPHTSTERQFISDERANAVQEWRGARDAASAYRNILVAIDQHQPAAVLERAVAMALRDRARLTLVAVVPTPSIWVYLVPSLPFDPRRALEIDCELRLRAAASAVPESVPVVTLLRHGSPAGALLTELRSGAHDLVVIGASRRRCVAIDGADRTLRRLVRRSSVPVFVVNPIARAQQDGMIAPAMLPRSIAQGA